MAYRGGDSVSHLLRLSANVNTRQLLVLVARH